MNIKNIFTIILGKMLLKILHMIGKQGGNLPGLILLTINKDALKSFSIDCPIIAVTGTNGKTSVTNYIGHIFKQSDKKIITNKLGNNLNSGICSLLLENCDIKGRINADYLIFETDESHVPIIYSQLKLETLVILNFFRDQLDRNGEVETLILKLQNFLADFMGNVILNADDPNVSRLGQANPNNKNIYYFSVEKYQGATNSPKEVGEGKYCPYCREKLKYEYYQYSHIGKFDCPVCHFGKVNPFVIAKYNTTINPQIEIENNIFTLNHSGIYHAYNLAAIFSVAKLYKIPMNIIKDTFEHFEVNNGRMENFKISDCNVLLNLAKNPVGTNVILRIINESKNVKELLFVLNDNVADGQDVSWIWDINFSEFKDVDRVITSGTRAFDIAIRIKCSGYDPEKIIVESDINKALNRLFDTKNDKYIITNYTAIQPTRNALITLKKQWR